MAAYRAGDLDGAIAAYTRCLDEGGLTARQQATGGTTRRRPGRRAGRKGRGARPDNPLMRDALAAAYAEAGRFDEALRTQPKALAMLRTRARPR